MNSGRDLASAAEDYALPAEQLARAQFYTCTERHTFHRYCILRDSPAFPLFFMDRCYDWQFESTGDVPIISRYNGLMELVCRESWVAGNFTLGQLAGVIRRVLGTGSHIALPIRLEYDNGAPWITEYLIEAIDEDDTVYCTKASSEHNSFRRPMSFTELSERVVLSADGLVAATEIGPSATIERILDLGSVAAFRAVFSEYGLRWEDGRLHSYVTPVVVSADGIDRLICSWEDRAEQIVAAGVIKKHEQSRLNKHLQNRFQPVQHYLLCLLDDEGISAAIGGRLAGRVRQQWDHMDTTLTGILKFASLLVQRPRMDSFDLYLKYLRQLRDMIPEYQQTNIEIQRLLTQ
jgi:hypothetical protein